MVMQTQTKSSAQNGYLTDAVVSQDGTRIGYRQYGQGAGLVLIQGTMGTAHNFAELAQALSDIFTVYVPDRRGRGMSKTEADSAYTTRKEIEDLDAMLNHTGAKFVFGLSSGAIIALEATRQLSAIHKLAIFEPPFFIKGLPVNLMKRYEREMGQGETASALVTAMLASEMGPAFLQKIPRWLLNSFVGLGLRQEDKKGAGEYETMRALAPTLRHDFTIIEENNAHLDRFQDLETPIMLLGGIKSQMYLKTASDKLATILPNIERIEGAGWDHSAAWNSDKGGKPQEVAIHLRKFFTA